MKAKLPILLGCSALVCSLAFQALAFGQTADADAQRKRLDEVASSYTRDHAFMGTVLVAHGNTLLLNKGYGQADLEWNIPNAPDVKFRLGSLTKQFTAALVLRLQQDGKLTLQDPVSKYLPDTPPAWAKITLANLLGHTSGIPNFTSDKDFMTWRMSPRTPGELLAFFRDKPLDFETGSKFAYSNLNYEVLGMVIEKASGMTYAEQLRQRLFDPLGMHDTGLDTDDLILPRRAQGYKPGPNGLEHAVSESMTVPWAAGSMYSTTGDLLRWEQALFGNKVLSEASLKAMTTPGKGGYGLGLFIRSKDGITIIDHGGGIEGFNTSLAYVPERRLTVVVLSNVNGSAPDQMSSQLLDVALGKLVTLASEKKALPIDAATLGRFAGTYQLAPTFAITVSVAGEQLTAQATGQPAFPIFYAGDAGGHPRFFLRVVDAELEFIPDATGNITSLILHQGGQNIPGKRQ